MASWTVHCDRAGCQASMRLEHDTDRQAIERVLELAELAGWSIAPDRFIRPREDLCPQHRSKP